MHLEEIFQKLTQDKSLKENLRVIFKENITEIFKMNDCHKTLMDNLINYFFLLRVNHHLRTGSETKITINDLKHK